MTVGDGHMIQKADKSYRVLVQKTQMLYKYICIPKRHQVAVAFFTWTLGAYLTLSQVPRINKLLMENVPRAIGRLDREFN